ncbi:ribosome maturation factor RimM [Massilia niastensis]|uniref:ribosome maturation factor RimM n=1 Tax=Massilia niastensis TaxID=544911 RepID=UPI0004768C2B|nr:ribosome maturation factor RimM [Massilia niastensis]
MQIPDDLVQVGHVTGAYGIVGGIRVSPYSDDADALLNIKTWWLDKPTLHAVTVRSAKLHGGDVVATLVGMRDRNEAEALKGASVQVARSEFPELEEDEYYWSDLIGLDVVNLQGEALGKVADMMHNGAQSILRITPQVNPDAPDAKASERLVPFVDQFVKNVDLEARLITLDWGLDF